MHLLDYMFTKLPQNGGRKKCGLLKFVKSVELINEEKEKFFFRSFYFIVLNNEIANIF